MQWLKKLFGFGKKEEATEEGTQSGEQAAPIADEAQAQAPEENTENTEGMQ